MNSTSSKILAVKKKKAKSKCSPTQQRIELAKFMINLSRGWRTDSIHKRQVGFFLQPIPIQFDNVCISDV